MATTPIRVDFGDVLYPDANGATAAFLDWYLMHVDPSVTVDGVLELLSHDIAARYFERYRWLTLDLIRAELPAAFKQAQFDHDRASENLSE